MQLPAENKAEFSLMSGCSGPCRVMNSSGCEGCTVLLHNMLHCLINLSVLFSLISQLSLVLSSEPQKESSLQDSLSCMSCCLVLTIQAALQNGILTPIYQSSPLIWGPNWTQNSRCGLSSAKYIVIIIFLYLLFVEDTCLLTQSSMWVTFITTRTHNQYMFSFSTRIPRSFFPGPLSSKLVSRHLLTATIKSGSVMSVPSEHTDVS